MIEQPTYIIVKSGIVQVMDSSTVSMMPIFLKYEDAQAFSRRHSGCTVAEIGSIAGETLEGHLEFNHRAGRTAVLVEKLLADGKIKGRPILCR